MPESQQNPRNSDGYHWIPNVDGKLDRGIIDWDYVASLIAKAPIDLPADFEIMLSSDRELEWLKVCHREAEEFYKKVLEKKGLLS